MISFLSSWTTASLNGVAASFPSESQMTAPRCPIVMARAPLSCSSNVNQRTSLRTPLDHTEVPLRSPHALFRPVVTEGVKMVNSQLVQWHFESGLLPQSIWYYLLSRNLQQLLHAFCPIVEATFSKERQNGSAHIHTQNQHTAHQHFKSYKSYKRPLSLFKPVFSQTYLSSESSSHLLLTRITTYRIIIPQEQIFKTTVLK